MILKNNSEDVKVLVRYFESLVYSIDKNLTIIVTISFAYINFYNNITIL